MGRPTTASGGETDSFAFKYVLSAISATIAESVTFPLDITKTRLQVQGEQAAISAGTIKDAPYRGMFKTAVGIVQEEGLFSLWQGLPPAVLRHIVYSGCRMAFYEQLRENVFKKNPDGYFPIWKSVVCGLTGGACAQFLASPADLVKVQMQMEGRRVLEGFPKRINSTFHAFQMIVKNFGWMGLWRGWLPNVQRAALVNLGDLTAYDTAKHSILRNTDMEDTYIVHAMASGCSGLVGATFGTPADVIKTRIMNNPELYKGSMDCLRQSIGNEGFFSLYRGFLPTWSRMVCLGGKADHIAKMS